MLLSFFIPSFYIIWMDLIQRANKMKGDELMNEYIAAHMTEWEEERTSIKDAFRGMFQHLANNEVKMDARKANYLLAALPDVNFEKTIAA